MNFEGLTSSLIALEQLVLDVRLACGSDEGRQPVKSADDFVRDGARLNTPRPADQAWYTERAFPVGVLLAAKRCRAGVRPGVLMWAVIGGVKHDRVVGHPEVIYRIKKLADCRVMFDHAIGIFGPRIEPWLVPMFSADMGAEVHAGRVHPAEERLTRANLPLHEIDGSSRRFVVDCLHP